MAWPSKFLILLDQLIDVKIDLALAEREVGADGYRSAPVDERKRVEVVQAEFVKAIRDAVKAEADAHEYLAYR